MAGDFFRNLREKLERSPSGQADLKFWERFNDEFSPSARKPPIFASLRWSFGWAGAAAAVAIVVGLWRFSDTDRPEALVAAGAESVEILQHEGMLRDMDLFLGTDGKPESTDYTALTEEEWEWLLKGT